MLNFQAVREEELTIAELTADLTREDLRILTDYIVNTIQMFITSKVTAIIDSR